MAYCSPKQLSQCLPLVVPKLSETLSDTHPKVKEAANKALKEIGQTIKNPEVSEIVDLLIRGLSDPYEKNQDALKVLLKTRFAHILDPQSLSFIVPILDYALRSRNSEMKTDASQIVGSISKLIKNSRELTAYLNIIFDALKVALCDNLSEVRTIAAKAVGQLTRKLHFEQSDRFLKILMVILEREEATTVERAGAAQGVSEIIAALGGKYLDQMIPKFLALTKDTRPWIKEGFIGVFVYLPSILENDFERYLKEVIDHVIDTLSDESEVIRSLTLRVLKNLIQKFGGTKTNVLLFPVYEGMTHSNWRKRNSSVILMGEMLDILRKLERQQGPFKTDIMEKILSSIYILRHDSVEAIRSVANQLWKNFVENTPKKLKIMLGTLIRTLVDLMIYSEELESICRNCLSQFAGKYGESLSGEIFDVLANIKKTENVNQIRGVCKVLREMIHSLNISICIARRDEIYNIISDLMTREDQSMRRVAFDVMRAFIAKTGNPAILDRVVPDFFARLEEAGDSEEDDQVEFTLLLFNELLESQIKEVLDYIQPKLFAQPMKKYCLQIITNNAEIFGPDLYDSDNLADFVPKSFEVLESPDFDKSYKDTLIYCLQSLSVHLEKSVIQDFLDDCMLKISNTDDRNQASSLNILEVLQFFFHNANFKYNRDFNPLIETLITYLTKSNKRIIEYAAGCLKSIFNSLSRENSYSVIEFIENKFEFLATEYPPDFKFPGFGIPEGIDSFVEIISNSMIYGSQKTCGLALSCFQFVLARTALDTIPQLTGMKMIGSLVRISTYKYEVMVKTKIVQIFSTMFKAGAVLPLPIFYPQLETVLFKMYTEFPQSPEYLTRIVYVYTSIIKGHSRKDYVIHEIWKSFKRTNDQELKYNYLVLMYKLLKQIYQKLSKLFAGNIAEEIAQLLVQEKSLSPKNTAQLSKILSMIVTQVPKEKLTASLETLTTRAKEINYKDIESNSIALAHFFGWVGILASVEDLTPHSASVKDFVGGFLNSVSKSDYVLYFLSLIKRVAGLSAKNGNLVLKLAKEGKWKDIIAAKGDSDADDKFEKLEMTLKGDVSA